MKRESEHEESVRATGAAASQERKLFVRLKSRVGQTTATARVFETTRKQLLRPLFCIEEHCHLLPPVLISSGSQWW